MTHDELNELIEKQEDAYQGMLQQAATQNAANAASSAIYNPYQNAANAASSAIYNPYQNVGSLYASSTGYNQMPQSYLEEKERQEIREHEREACVRIVMDMAEELNCPNLLHGVALAIKARSALKVTKY
jgi:hypothetical protein